MDYSGTLELNQAQIKRKIIGERKRAKENIRLKDKRLISRIFFTHAK